MLSTESPKVITCPPGTHSRGNDQCVPDKVDCSKTANDPQCQIICSKPVGKSTNNFCPPPPTPIKCKPDEHIVNGKCEKIKCLPSYHLQNGICTRTIVKRVTTVETVVRNFITNQPSFLLLLDTAQLCQLAGDTQCVAKQNQFNTLNLVTKLDSTTNLVILIILNGS